MQDQSSNRARGLTRVARTCERCGASFTVKAAVARIGKGRYCSKACQLVPRINCLCLQCGASFSVTSLIPGKREGKFCSRLCASTYRHRPWQERFWGQVDKNGPVSASHPEKGPCWLWVGSRRKTGGHGLFTNDAITPNTQQTHRLAWQLLRGPIPDGAMVCHACPDGENPACVNPDHLYLGDAQSNADDRARYGRTARGARTNRANWRRGEAHHMTTLTVDQVRELRARADAGTPCRVLAREYGLRPESIWRIWTRRTWADV